MNQQSQQEPALEESRAKRSEQLEAGAHCPAREKLVESLEEEAAGAAHLLRPLLVLVFLRATTITPPGIKIEHLTRKDAREETKTRL